MDAGERKCTIQWPNSFYSDRAYSECKHVIPNKVNDVMFVVPLRMNIVTFMLKVNRHIKLICLR